MPKATEELQYLQHAFREPAPCKKCDKRTECAEAEMACERFFRYVRKEPFKMVSTVPNAHWLVLVEAE